MKRLVVGVLAHVDSGKTTLSEALLYRAGSIRKLGRVDHRDAFLDTDALEKARGITIFAKQAVLTLPAGTVTGTPLEETQITLLDTPGHVDFHGDRADTAGAGLCGAGHFRHGRHPKPHDDIVAAVGTLPCANLYLCQQNGSARCGQSPAPAGAAGPLWGWLCGLYPHRSGGRTR